MADVLVVAHHEVVGLAAPLLLSASGLTVSLWWRLSTGSWRRRQPGAHRGDEA